MLNGSALQQALYHGGSLSENPANLPKASTIPKQTKIDAINKSI